MSISVVMPILIKTNEHLSMTNRCIELARGRTAIPFELIIVESGSTYFQDYADLHVYEKNVSTPEIAHNIGFRMACRNNIIVLLTNDVFVGHNWLEVLEATFSAKPDCGLATLATSFFGHEEHDEIAEDYWFDVCAIKREVFEQVGFYDERFNGSFPDRDLLIRAYKEGWKMYRNYNCVVDLAGTQTTVGTNPHHKDNYERGHRLFIEKHEGCGLPIYEAVK